MTAVRLILLGALISLAGVAVFYCFRPAENPAVQQEILTLVHAYDDALYLDDDYQSAKSIATKIVEIAKESADPAATETRGLARLAYTEIYFGKWGNKWRKNLKKCEEMATTKLSVARAEMLLYSGTIKGKWQRKFKEGIADLQKAVWLADHIQDDRTLALAHTSLCELHGFLDQPNSVARNAYRGLTVSRHYGQKSITVRTLDNLIDDLFYLDKYQEAAAIAKELQETRPGSPKAMYARFFVGQSEQYQTFVDELAKEHERRKQTGQKTTVNQNAYLGKSLSRLATAYVHRHELEKAQKYATLAIPYLKIANDKTFEGICDKILRVVQLDEANDVAEIDEIVSSFDQLSHNPEDIFVDAIAAAYAKVGATKQNLYWRELGAKTKEKRHADEFGFLRTSAELQWDAALRLRQQTKINKQTAEQSRSRIGFLTNSLLLGSTVSILLGTFYFLLRRERDSLEQTVKTRTMSLSKAIQEANIAGNAKSDFLAQINHEIRNPLTAILGYCDLLSLTKPNDSTELVQGISSSSKHLRQLVDQILEVSKIETSGLELNAAEFFPQQTLNDVSGIMAEQAATKGLEFECSFEGDHEHSVISDETKIRQVAINLIGNAIKFTDQGSVQASFLLDKKENSLAITVNDTGAGIPENETANVFDRFSKASNGTGHEGSGLGLFITKQLVNCLGGKIELASELGSGTRVHVTLPIKAISKTPTTPELPPQLAKNDLGTNSGKRVLIVDDQSMIRETLKLQLSVHGLDCETTCKLDKTIELVENWQPHLVLLDLRMPGISGFEVFKEIRQSGNFTVPVYAMTGDATPQVQEKCLTAGFDGFITKPFRISSVVDILASQGDSNGN